MSLNHAKCSFRVQARKFLGFMLPKSGIKESLDKFQVVIDMRISTNIK